MAPQESKNTYTVGWIAVLFTEQAAAIAMLDEEHETPFDFEKPDGDDNSYIWGRIGLHNIVIAGLPDGGYGLVSAATTAKSMAMSFPIRFGLMVGIGGGIPRLEDKIDIRLGDVVVSRPEGARGGVAQYDSGKATADGFVLRGYLNGPPIALLKAVGRLRAKHEKEESRIPEIMKDILAKNPKMAKATPGKPSYAHQRQEHDRLFQDDYTHVGGRNCASCDISREVHREAREDSNPIIHYGMIASGSAVIKHAADRAEVLRRLDNNCLCVETEAAGLMNEFPCLVVRGICDYADSHKNDRWQPYAAVAAAAYAKELLSVLDGGEIAKAQTAKDILSNVADLAAETKLIAKEIKGVVEASLIGEWLCSSDSSTNYHKAMKKRHQDTGQWLFRDPRYSKWEEGENSFLWLTGNSGCGKTVLSSTVIEKLENSTKSNIVLYFYFDFSDVRKQTLESAVRAFATQLYHTNLYVRKPLDNLFSLHKNGTQQPSLASLQATFQQMLQQVEELWIVLDALDECPIKQQQRQELLGWIQELHTGSRNTHILITSRPELDIKFAMARQWASAADIITLDSDMVSRDISSYVRWEVREGSRLERWRGRNDVQQEIEDALLGKAHGMFRWVSCQIDVLESCKDYRAVHEALRSLPDTLHETYSRILTGIPKSELREAKLLLQFLVFSERPLQVNEAVDALAVDSKQKTRFDKRRRMPKPEEISGYCTGLIVIVTIVKSGLYGQLKTTTELQLAHFSVKEYFLSGNIDKSFAEDLQEPTARACIAEACLAYLLELDDSKPTNQLCSFYPLAPYAAKYWALHSKATTKRFESVHTLAMELFGNLSSFRMCLKIYNPEKELWDINDQEYSTLYYASLCGLSHCVEELLSGDSAAFHDKSIECIITLQDVEGKEHFGSAYMILEAAIESNAQSGKYGTPLQAASSGGHEKVVQILLDKGANINGRGGYYGNALQAASYGGDEKVVQILLDKGANING